MEKSYVVVANFYNGECKEKPRGADGDYFMWKAGMAYSGKDHEALLAEGLIAEAGAVPAAPAKPSEAEVILADGIDGEATENPLEEVSAEMQADGEESLEESPKAKKPGKKKG